MQFKHKISVLIADDSPLIRWGLKEFFKTRGIAVVGDADSVAEVLVETRSKEPDAIVMDTALRGESCMEAVRELTRDKARCILAFSSSEQWDRIEAFLDAGGMGYASKRGSLDELITALEAVVCNCQWISPCIRKSWFSENTVAPVGFMPLSQREKEITGLVARGLTSRQIADQLCVSMKTVETHRYRVFRKLKIGSRAQLVDYAITHGILSVTDSTKS